jgi:predicted enzyme related to lactoylglutathione lyase
VVNVRSHFAWYELITTDVEAAKTFYTNVIGWGARDASVPGRTYILFTAGEGLVGGLMGLPESARETGGKPRWVGYVGVEDVDDTVERVKRLGGAVHVPPTDIPNISRFAVFADPQSAALGLLESLGPGHGPAAEMGAPGRVGWHELFAADWEQAFAFYSEVFGWHKADTDVGEMSTYQLFSAEGQTIGGMLTKSATTPGPFWLYYFNVDNIDTAAQRVKAGGGQIVDGPLEVPGGSSWVVLCKDPADAIFALEGRRGRTAIGYFERASRTSADPRGRRWSW